MPVNWHDRYPTPQEPRRTLRPMTPDDLDAAVALSRSVGWQHTHTDWERLRFWSEGGCYVIDEDGRGLVGTVTTTPYSIDLGWIGMVIVAPDRQRRGLGGQLLRAAIDHLVAQGVQRIMLDASDSGRPLYERSGFRVVCKIERWQGRASTYLGPRARAMRPDDVAAVLAEDRALFGLARGHILIRLLEEFPDLAWVDRQGTRINGYLMGQRRQHGVQLGPWMSWDVAAGERLLRVALEQLQGEPVTLHIPDSNGRARLLVENHNLRKTAQRTRMIYGDATPPRGELLAEMAITSLATG